MYPDIAFKTFATRAAGATSRLSIGTSFGRAVGRRSPPQRAALGRRQSQSPSGLQSTTVGRIRLLCQRLAAKTVVGPKLGQFARAYPAVELEITTDDSRVDLVSADYDVGIQFGEYIAQEMVAVRVSPDLRPATLVHLSTSPHTPRDVLVISASASGTGR